MSNRIMSRSIGTLGGLLLVLVSACAVEGGGYGYGGDVDAGYVGGVYEPYGYDYGGWGRGYRVGPPRGGPGPGGWRGGGHPGGHAPGIPSGPHGGGGGFHGGGGHH
jgi:hypothetical protein